MSRMTVSMAGMFENIIEYSRKDKKGEVKCMLDNTLKNLKEALDVDTDEKARKFVNELIEFYNLKEE